MNAKYKIKHYCIWRPKCLVQEAKGTGSSSKCFLFHQVNTQGPITLLTTKLYLNALQLRQKAVQTIVVWMSLWSLRQIKSAKSSQPPQPPLLRMYSQKDLSTVTDSICISYLKHIRTSYILPVHHALRDTCNRHSNSQVHVNIDTHPDTP